MKTIFYSVKEYEQPYLERYSKDTGNELLVEQRLDIDTAFLAEGFDIVSIFSGDDASAPVLEALYENGVRFITVRATGVDNVDLKKCTALGITVANIPGYSPNAIAEHAVALMLALNRKLILANRQVHTHDFTTTKLIGFDFTGKTVGIIGCGRIGSVLARIMHGFGCKVLAYDLLIDKALTAGNLVKYVTLEQLCKSADIISINTGLTQHTHYIINAETLSLMKPTAMLINTGRGGCVDTAAVLDALDNGKLGYYGADVYEKEMGVFFHDCSHKMLDDPLLERLLASQQVLLTPHQAFATREALSQIAEITFYHINWWNKRQWTLHELTRPALFPSAPASYVKLITNT